MNKLTEEAPAFVEMAHSIVWCSAATVDSQGRPRSRMNELQDNVRKAVAWIEGAPALS